MKKVLLPLVAMLFCMTACNKDNEGFLTLEIEHYSSNAKLHLDDDNYAVWNSDDVIWLNGDEVNVNVSNANHHALIEVETPADSYTAIYPYDWVDESVDAPNVTYPVSQSYYINRNVKAPMAAFCGTGENVLRFRNLGSILAVEVTNAINVDISVSSIVVTATDEDGEAVPITGNYTIDLNTYELTPSSTGTNTVTLECSSPVTIAPNNSETFYIALPPTDAKLSIQVNDNGYNPTICQATSHTYSRSYGYLAPFHFGPKSNEIWYTANSEITSVSNMTLNSTLCTYDATTKKGVLAFTSDIAGIPDYAFQGNSSLLTLTLPANVTSIGECAFENCPNLTSAYMPNVTSIGKSAFVDCGDLTSAHMPNVTSIGRFAFRECSSLTSAYMPNVTSIENAAFLSCSSLTSVYVSGALTTVVGSIFEGCDITHLYFYSEPHTGITKDSFNISSTTGKTLHVPDGSTYDWASWWGTGGTISYDL